MCMILFVQSTKTRKTPSMILEIRYYITKGYLSLTYKRCLKQRTNPREKYEKYTNTQFTRTDIKIALKHMKRCSNLLTEKCKY